MLLVKNIRKKALIFLLFVTDDSKSAQFSTLDSPCRRDLIIVEATIEYTPILKMILESLLEVTHHWCATHKARVSQAKALSSSPTLSGVFLK